MRAYECECMCERAGGARVRRPGSRSAGIRRGTRKNGAGERGQTPWGPGPSRPTGPRPERLFGAGQRLSGKPGHRHFRGSDGLQGGEGGLFAFPKPEPLVGNCSLLGHFPNLIVFTEIRQHVRELQQQGYRRYELKSKTP